MKIFLALAVMFAMLVPFLIFYERLIKNGAIDKVEAWLLEYFGKIGGVVIYWGVALTIGISGMLLYFLLMFRLGIYE
ncbi:hypothetical protein N8349_03650 [Gammaproteobacteria bacterium]|nr:hypothetical protein [Gammaproteobacteria bacterium]